eukprot:2043339-Karenia_brevis.AAC.1
MPPSSVGANGTNETSVCKVFAVPLPLLVASSQTMRASWMLFDVPNGVSVGSLPCSTTCQSHRV